MVTCIKSRLGSHTLKKYKWYQISHLLATLATHVGTPSSGSASENTYIQTNLDLMKLYVDKLIDRLTTIVPSRTTLGKILSSTWVFGLYS